MTLTHDDIQILNAARDILKALSHEAAMGAWNASNNASDEGPHPGGLGRLAEAADNAEQAIFQTLNVGATYGRLDIPDDLMHNRKVTA
jgi:hypothetical protein